jgi:hypothetical protein
MIYDSRPEQGCFGREIWVGDGSEGAEGEAPLAADALTALLAIGYEAFSGHPILPSSVMLQAAEDIAVYSLGRAIKDSEDAAEYLYSRTPRHHVNEFLRQMVGMVEDLHARGLHTPALIAEIDARVPAFAQTAIRVNNLGHYASKGQLCTAVWEELLMARSLGEVVLT